MEQGTGPNPFNDPVGYRAYIDTSSLKRVGPFVQLDIRAPRIVNKRKRGTGLLILGVGPVQFNAGRFEFLTERFQVLDVEADVVEHPPFGGNRRLVFFGKC